MNNKSEVYFGKKNGQGKKKTPKVPCNFNDERIVSFGISQNT